jgi:hypothetical protein
MTSVMGSQNNGVASVQCGRGEGRVDDSTSSSHGAAAWGDCFSRRQRCEARKWRRPEVEENGTRVKLGQLRPSGTEARWVA